MSVDVYIRGVRNADGRLADMVALKVQCDKVGASYPDMLREYFYGTDALDYKEPVHILQSALEVNLTDLQIDGLLDGNVAYGEGLTVRIDRLPPDITSLRIFCS